jgi:hypothetical protein
VANRITGRRRQHGPERLLEDRMQGLIHTVALAAALAAVIASLWGDYGLLVALKRAVVSYLAFYFVAAVLVLVYQAGILAEGRPKPPGGEGADETGEGASPPGAAARAPGSAD